LTLADDLVAGLRAGDRRALARAITVAESTRPDHRATAAAVLDAVLPATGAAHRLGVSGAPGAGKSSLIEALGAHLTGSGHRVAVLAVDPTSTRSGGSILGDKTRMERLARDPGAFIRPSPSGGSLGGVARRTREAVLLCEAAGFDVVVVETVGVGQSETAVAAMVDLFALLVAPAGGDELQGIKRGVTELADLVVVTKADGELAAAARHAAADYRAALPLFRPRHEGWTPPVVQASSVTGAGVGEVWEVVTAHRRALAASGRLDELRAEQARAWMWEEIRGRMEDDLRADPGVNSLLPELERRVTDGQVSATAAAHAALAAYGGDGSGAGAAGSAQGPSR
jgi:LAO/AO transport system kinase